MYELYIYIAVWQFTYKRNSTAVFIMLRKNWNDFWRITSCDTEDWIMGAKKNQIWHPKNKLYLKDNTAVTILILFNTILVLRFSRILKMICTIIYQQGLEANKPIFNYMPTSWPNYFTQTHNSRKKLIPCKLSVNDVAVRPNAGGLQRQNASILMHQLPWYLWTLTMTGEGQVSSNPCSIFPQV